MIPDLETVAAIAPILAVPFVAGIGVIALPFGLLRVADVWRKRGAL